MRPDGEPNRRRSHDTNEWQYGDNIDRDECLAFLGIIVAMGLVREPEIKDYWSTDPFFHIAGISGVMSRNRFEVSRVNLSTLCSFTH